MERITSRSNEKIKYAIKVMSSASERAASGNFFLEGARLCSDAANTGLTITRAFFTGEALKKYADYISAITDVCSECYEISNDVASKLSDTGSSQGVFCICARPDNKCTKLDANGRYIALENVQDPSNLGAICRTAEALGLGLIVSGGCDVYNPKALRAAMGSSLRLDIKEVENLPDLIEQAKQEGMLTLASSPRSDAEDIRRVNMAGGVICCVGNEGNGLTDAVMDACNKRVTIPMSGRAESFNAAAAAAILAWELKR